MASVFAFASAVGARGRLLSKLEAMLSGLLAFSAGAVPRLIPVLFGLLGAIAAINVFSTDPKRLFVLLKSACGITLALFIAYLFVNATWAPEWSAGLTKSAAVLGIAAAAFLIAASYSLRDHEEARALANSALSGLLIGAAFLLIETLFDEPIMRFIDNHIVHIFNAGRKNSKVIDGELIKVSAFVLNRNAASSVLLLVPMLLFTGAPSRKAVRLCLFMALLGLVGISVLLSQSGTSVVALFLGAAVFGLSALSLKTTRLILVTGWVMAMLLAVPLSRLPYELGWQHWTWLPPESVAARFYIWKYCADEVPKQPLTGIGIRGTEDLHLVIPMDPNDSSRGYALKGRHPRHPHNAFLQTWLELGAFGAVLLLAVGLAGLWALRDWPPTLQRSAYALFAACCAIGLSGFDMFQTWLLASIALAWAFLSLANSLQETLPEHVGF
jgi:exopolysaccharide production protein ExoQ